MGLTRLLGPLLLIVTTAEGLNSCLTDARCAPGVTDLRLNICDLRVDDIPDLEACFDRIGRSNIQNINLANNELRRVPVDFLEGFGSLLTLNLVANRLFVQPNNFRGATALQVLNLADNNMESLPTGAFEDLTSLRELNLVDNNLRLQSGSFKGASSVEILHFTDNDLETLSAGIFEGLTSLRELDISFNSLESLSAEGLAGLPSLTVLSLRDNNMPTVEPGTFVGSPALEILDLERNRLATLTTEVFDGVRRSLVELSLGWNRLVTLPADIFEGMSVLTTLDLASNDFETLPAPIFEDLATLGTLRLNRNDLVTLPAGLFDGTPSLEELSLIDNEGLQCIPALPDSVTVDLQLDADATCECPEFPTCDENGDACECQPGTDGYSCVGSSSGLITAFECDFSALVDAGERTTVTVEASGLDARTSGFGCSPSGCTPENTRDNNLEANSRWSCSGNLVEGNGDCCIQYFFDEPQDIVKINIAFARGTERTRLLSVFDNGDFHSQIESSGLTDDFEEFVLNTDETADLTVCLDDSRPDSEFLSITEVQFMVE